MKTRTLVLIPIFIFVVVAIFIFASCDTTGNGGGNDGVTPSIPGTWANPDYDGISGVGEGGNPAKIVMTAISGNEYTWDIYLNHDDTEAGATVTMTVTNQWTDSEGNLFVEIEGFLLPDPEFVYFLTKIHADNQTMEFNLSYVDYPAEIDPNEIDDSDYGIYYRQSSYEPIQASFLGTWINPDYDGTWDEGGNAGKIVTTHVSGNDYMAALYINIDDTTPVLTVPSTVTNEWTDSEGNLFTESIVYPPDGAMYSLGKLHADNQTSESNASEADYPTEIDPAGEEYVIYYRQ